MQGKDIKWDDIPVGEHENKEYSVTCRYSDLYFRAIAKIAFHYFLQYFDHYSGAEDEFDGIKNFIMNGDNVKAWVRQVEGSFVDEFIDEHVSITNYVHLLTVEDTGDRIFAKLAFFCGPQGLQGRHFEVQIGDSPGTIKTPLVKGHHILYFKEEDQNGNIGEMKKLGLIGKDFLASLRFPKKEKLGDILRIIKKKK